MPVESKINPTITLAQLYEVQKQYFDAYNIYSLLYLKSPTADLKARLEASERKMFTELDMEYNKTTNFIFSKEDLMKFRMLPDPNYKVLKQPPTTSPLEPTEFVAEEFPENENDTSEAEEIVVPYTGITEQTVTPKVVEAKDPHKVDLPDFSKILVATENQIQETLNSIPDIKDATELTISQFAALIIKKLTDDKKMSELTLKDLKLIFDELFK
jgi:hypothetical protein